MMNLSENDKELSPRSDFFLYLSKIDQLDPILKERHMSRNPYNDFLIRNYKNTLA